MQSCFPLLALAKTLPFLPDRNWNSQFSTSLHLPHCGVMSVNNKQPGHNLQLCKSTAGSRNRGSFVLEPTAEALTVDGPDALQLRQNGASSPWRSRKCVIQGDKCTTARRDNIQASLTVSCKTFQSRIKMSARNKRRLHPENLHASQLHCHSLMKVGTG